MEADNNYLNDSSASAIIADETTKVDETSLGKKAIVILECVRTAISMIGIVLNVLTFLVFSRKKLRKRAFGRYFRVKLIADTLSLIHSFRDLAEYVFDCSLDNVPNIFLCKFVEYSLYVSWSISCWMVVLIALDRFVSIAFHQKYNKMKIR
jgi:hypothetical protein